MAINATSITILVLLGVAVIWGFWLIFKRDLMSINLGKLIAYFLGVIVTLMIVLWIVGGFLPWWANTLVSNITNNAAIPSFNQKIEQLVGDIVQGPVTVTEPGEVAQPTPITQPTGVAPQPTTSPVNEPNASGQSVPATGEQNYIVQRGDTLYSISKKYTGVEVADIRTRNGIINDGIYAGQTLIIPAP